MLDLNDILSGLLWLVQALSSFGFQYLSQVGAIFSSMLFLNILCDAKLCFRM